MAEVIGTSAALQAGAAGVLGAVAVYVGPRGFVVRVKAPRGPRSSSGVPLKRGWGLKKALGCWATGLRPRIRALEPAVELQLVVALVGERSAAFKVGLQVALHALDDASGLRIGRLAEPPPDLQLAAERRELRCRSAVVAVDAGLAVPNQRLRQAAQRPQTPYVPQSRSGVCLEKISAPAPARE